MFILTDRQPEPADSASAFDLLEHELISIYALMLDDSGGPEPLGELEDAEARDILRGFERFMAGGLRRLTTL